MCQSPEARKLSASISPPPYQIVSWEFVLDGLEEEPESLISEASSDIGQGLRGGGLIEELVQPPSL